VAVVGMAGRFPGARDVEQFWANLCAGVESVERIERVPDDPDRYVPASPIFEGVEEFDADFFGMTPREAALTDPQQRLFLECSWTALEHAGHDPRRFDGRIGVYGGTGLSSYLLLNLWPSRAALIPPGEYPAAMLHGNDKDYLTTRVSYRLGLTGPSVAVQTACSTSLVTVALACQGLLDYQCDLALAGGVSVKLPPRAGYIHQPGGILSPDGHCRAFDARAAGTLFGSGVGVIILRRLSDALADGDTVHAVILSAAINNDGSGRAGFTAPSIDGQAAVILTALEQARIEPATIGYVEGHGTGTAIGDPIEVAALTKAFSQATTAMGTAMGPASCMLGSVKTNVGHLNAAAGMAGLVKVVLAVERGFVPPSLHFERPNPLIDFAAGPFHVNDALAPWPAERSPRRAGVSSFGIGGTNAHVIVEEPPERPAPGPSRPWQLLIWSARTPDVLERATDDLTKELRTRPNSDLPDLAWTLQVGRRPFPHRHALVCADGQDAAAVLASRDHGRMHSGLHSAGPTPVAFLFPGQGGRHDGMAASLYDTEPVFRAELDSCAELLHPHLAVDVRDFLGPYPELRGTVAAQPVLFALEWALARLWESFGVEPEAMLGHSLGELVAACLAGVLPLGDALAFVATRARLMQGLPAGAMLVVPLPEVHARDLLGDELDLAAVNAPARCVLSGPAEAVAQTECKLAARGIATRRLITSHAFHSAALDPIIEPLAEHARRLHLAQPRIPFVSSVTGTWITANQATDPAYWASHARQTVRFADGLLTLSAAFDGVLLEVGPGQALSTLSRQVGNDAMPLAIPSLPPATEPGTEPAALLEALGAMWVAGIEVDWWRRSEHERRRRLPLPTYPFERRRHWIDPPSTSAATAPTATPEPPVTTVSALGMPNGASDQNGRPDGARRKLERHICEIWKELLGIPTIGQHDDFFALGGDSLLATQIASRVRDRLGVEIPLDRLLDSPTVTRMADIVEELLIARLTDTAADPVSVDDPSAIRGGPA
jgi:acyl transferase domain-containing protein/acyl carrier protein